MIRFMKGLFGLVVGAVALFGGVAYAEAAVGCYFHSEQVGFVCSTEPQPARFRPPQTPDTSFLGKTKYGRLSDYANIYAEPSRASAVVRNVGDGFLYATIAGQMRVDGQNWYLINQGEWVNEADVKLVNISGFHGVEVLQHPERPFGWIVGRQTFPSSAPGAEPDPAFAQMERYTFFEVYGATLDEEDWIWYDLGDGRWVRQTEVSLITPQPRPAEVGPNEFWVTVDLYEQNLAAYEGDQMVFATLISSGLNRWPTREGIFQVFDRWERTKMSGAEGRVDYYFIEDVPHTMYFDEKMEIALHGAYWHDRFGFKHSHGCVNMPPYAAEWVFNWSEQSPSPLWVWVRTSDPTSYFKRYGQAASSN